MFVGIYCCTDKNGIGLNNKMPWDNKEELAWFKKMTINHNVIMGRKTFESINNKPLVNRNNIVISKTLTKGKNNGYFVLNNINDIYKIKSRNINYIIGGKSIIEQTYIKCKYLLVSMIDGNYLCDTFLNLDYYQYFDLQKVINFKSFKVMIWKNKNQTL